MSSSHIIDCHRLSYIIIDYHRLQISKDIPYLSHGLYPDFMEVPSRIDTEIPPGFHVCVSKRGWVHGCEA